MKDVSRLYGMIWDGTGSVHTPLRVAFEAAEALALGLLVFEDLPPIGNSISFRSR
jgi:hypothetical protein